MPRRAAGLTARQVDTKRGPGLFADGGGLYLKVTAGGARSWIFRYQLKERRRDMGLGSVKDFTLAEARERVLEVRRQVSRGLDPIEARRTDRSAAALAAAKPMTFAECAEAYIAAHEAGWRNAKHKYQWRQTIGSYANPVFGSLPVQAVDLGLVMRAIEPLWVAKTETAVRVRSRIERVLDWATTRGYRHGENPARWRGHLDTLLPAASKVRPVKHYAALPYPEIGAFLVQLNGQDGVSARALEFAILTAARTGEVLGARWSEVDFGERIWVVPAARMKAGKEHRVPLANKSLAILDTMAEVRQGELVFPGGRAFRPLSNMALVMTMRRMGFGELTVHGFRSTFRDWAAERSTFPSEVAEMALAHSVGDKVEQAYRRGDLFEKRRELAEAWATFCTTQLATGRVVPIRRGA